MNANMGRPSHNKKMDLSKECILTQEDYTNILYSMRINSGLSQVEAAKSIGVSDITIWNWENGVACPSISMLIDVFNFYGYKIKIVEDKKC